MNTLNTKVHRLLLGIGCNDNAHHLTTCTTVNSSHNARYRTYELHFRMLLVNKQSLPGLDMLALSHHHLGSNAYEVIGYECVLLRCLHGYQLLIGSALELNVQAFS